MDSGRREEAQSRTALVLGLYKERALARARGIVFGVGGVGSWCAEALVRTGIGHLMLVDDDVVAPSNLNRQLPATVRTIGRAKAEVLRERFLEINPNAEITARTERYTPESAPRFNLAAYDFVVDAIDSVECKAHLIRSALAVPSLMLVSSMGAACRIDPGRVRVSPFRKVEGDGLARALRQRFRKEDGELPKRDFACVWSDEPPIASAVGEDGARGSLVTVTATFGLRLAAEII